MTKTLQDPIGVGIIGAGLSARIFHAPFITTNPSFKLVSILRSSSAAPLQGYPSVPVTTSQAEFFSNSEIQLVVITTPSDSHDVFAKAALDAGKHVVVEKPFTLTVDQGLELVSLAKSKGLVLAVYHNRRWDGDFLTFEKLVGDTDGPLGRVVEYSSHFDRFRPAAKPNSWRESASNPGTGILYDLGSHLIHQYLVLTRKSANRKIKVTAQIKDMRKLTKGAEIDDYFSVSLDNGEILSHLNASMLAKIPGPRFLVHGTKGSLQINELDPQEDQLKTGVSPVDPSFGVSSKLRHVQLVTESINSESASLLERGSYVSFYENVADALKIGAESLDNTAIEAVNVIGLIQAAKISAEQGISVEYTLLE